MVTHEQARSAKRKLVHQLVVAHLGDPPWLRGIGITRVGGDFAVKVNVAEASVDTVVLPHSVDGVRVVVDLVGEMRALGATESKGSILPWLLLAGVIGAAWWASSTGRMTFQAPEPRRASAQKEKPALAGPKFYVVGYNGPKKDPDRSFKYQGDIHTTRAAAEADAANIETMGFYADITTRKPRKWADT